MIPIFLSLSYIYAIYLLSILVSISCIIHDLIALGVIHKIQVMGFLKVDD